VLSRIGRTPMSFTGRSALATVVAIMMLAMFKPLATTSSGLLKPQLPPSPSPSPPPPALNAGQRVDRLLLRLHETRPASPPAATAAALICRFLAS
jgi:hypothetical protein